MESRLAQSQAQTKAQRAQQRLQELLDEQVLILMSSSCKSIQLDSCTSQPGATSNSCLLIAVLCCAVLC